MAMNANQVVLVGNITDDPELRFTPSGVAVASFTIAVNRRTRDQASGEWKDGETAFLRCNVWRQQAENCAESLSKGTHVIVLGRLRTRSWETAEGQKRSATEIEVDSVGPSLEFATAQVTRTPRGNRDSVPAWAGASPVENGNGPLDEEPPF